MLVTPFGTIAPGYLTGDYAGSTGPGLGNFIHNLVTTAFLVSGLGTFAFLIMGGIRYLTAGGDTKATEAAVKTITNAVIGLTIVLGAFGIARVLESVFGISIFRPVFQGP